MSDDPQRAVEIVKRDGDLLVWIDTIYSKVSTGFACEIGGIVRGFA